MESVKQNFIEKLKVFATELTDHVTLQPSWEIGKSKDLLI